MMDTLVVLRKRETKSLFSLLNHKPWKKIMSKFPLPTSYFMKLQLEGSRLRGCWWQIKKILYSCDVWASWFLLLFGVRLHENTCYFWQFFWKTCIQLDLHLSNIPWILSSLFRFYEKWDSRITRVLWMTQISKNQTLHLFLGVVQKKSNMDF